MSGQSRADWYYQQVQELWRQWREAMEARNFRLARSLNDKIVALLEKERREQ